MESDGFRAGRELFRESSCLLPPSRPVSLRNRTRLDHSLETSLTPNRFARLNSTVSASSLKTISRTGARKSRLSTYLGYQGSPAKGLGSGSESDSELHQKETASESEVVPIDIFDDSMWDTDLETEETKEPYDHSGRTAYINRCKILGVTPVSYFLRHMHDKELDLRYHGLGGKGLMAATPTIAASCHVQKLDVSDNCLHQVGGLALCELVKENCFISHLICSDNMLCRCAHELCEALIQNDTLTHLTLSGNNLSDSSAPAVTKLIHENKKIEYLDLSHNKFEEESGKILGPAICENTCIRHLDLSWNFLRSKGIEAINLGLKSNVSLKTLNLSWNGMNRIGAKSLGDALKGNSALESLDISNTRISTEGAALIGVGLAANETLKTLKMSRNPMESAGCHAICAAILRNPGSVIEQVYFQDIYVNKDFDELLRQLRERYPDIKVMYGGFEVPKRPRAKIHPMEKLTRYMKRSKLRLVDFFNRFDKDNNMSVSKEEFIQGLESQEDLKTYMKEVGIQINEEELALLLKELDKDDDGEISYSELVTGHTNFMEQEKPAAKIADAEHSAVLMEDFISQVAYHYN